MIEISEIKLNEKYSNIGIDIKHPLFGNLSYGDIILDKESDKYYAFLGYVLCIDNITKDKYPCVLLFNAKEPIRTPLYTIKLSEVFKKMSNGKDRIVKIEEKYGMKDHYDRELYFVDENQLFRILLKENKKEE